MSSDERGRSRPQDRIEEGSAAPEPGLTPADLIARAASFRGRLRAEQDRSEARGCHSPELQEAFVRAGFYRALQPKRFGGYELDYTTFYRAMVEIARGDPGGRLVPDPRRDTLCADRRPLAGAGADRAVRRRRALHRPAPCRGAGRQVQAGRRRLCRGRDLELLLRHPLRHAFHRQCRGFPPGLPWYQHVDVQRPFGQALMLTDTAEAVLIQASEMYMAYCRRWAGDGTPFAVEDSLRLWGMLLNAGGLACDAVDLLFRAASSAAARKGQRIERYYRDCAMYRSHTSAQLANLGSGLGRLHFGLPMGMFGI